MREWHGPLEQLLEQLVAKCHHDFRCFLTVERQAGDRQDTALLPEGLLQSCTKVTCGVVSGLQASNRLRFHSDVVVCACNTEAQLTDQTGASRSSTSSGLACPGLPFTWRCLQQRARWPAMLKAKSIDVQSITQNICLQPQANIKRAWERIDREVHAAAESRCLPRSVPALRSCLASLCFYHAVMVTRGRFGPTGWSATVYDFNESDLDISRQVLYNGLAGAPGRKAPQIVPWEQLRFVVWRMNSWAGCGI